VVIIGSSECAVVTSFAFHTTHREQCSASSHFSPLLRVPRDSLLPRRQSFWKAASRLELGVESETNAANQGQATEILSNDNEPASMTIRNPITHHVALRVRDIELSIKFYSLLGFAVETKFRAGPAKAAWLKQQQQQQKESHDGTGMRIELIEIPKHMLQEPEGKRARAPHGFQNEVLLGFNHMALDVTQIVRAMNTTDIIGAGTNEGEEPQPSCGCDTFGLSNYMEVLNQTSLDEFNKSLRVAMEPKQIIVGQDVYEMAFIYEPDGALIELLSFQTRLQSKIEYDGWEPWKETSFGLL
jgi:catechol 2,3-dioxygenase-like lactoylglutathione lyase family enzyme